MMNIHICTYTRRKELLILDGEKELFYTCLMNGYSIIQYDTSIIIYIL